MPNPIVLSPVEVAPKPILANTQATEEQVSQLILLVAQSGIIQLPPGKTWDKATTLSFSYQKETENKAAFWKIGAIFAP